MNNYPSILLIFLTLSCVTLPRSPLDKTSYRWKALPLNEALGPLALHQCLVTESGVVVFGGIRDDRGFDPFVTPLSIFDIKKHEWRNLPVSEERLKSQVANASSTILVVFGGIFENDKYSRDLYLIDVKKAKADKIKKTKLDGRIRHGISVLGDKAIIYGGEGSESKLNFGYIDLAKKKITVKDLPDFVANKTSFVSLSFVNKLMIWGGFEFGLKTNSGYIYDLSLDTWRQISKAPISPRANALAVSTKDKAFIFGGSPLDNNANSGAIYDIKADSWTIIPAIPDKRYESINNPSLTVISESKVLLWGGRIGNQEFISDAWVFDLNSNTWSKFNQENTPSPRMLHCMVNYENKLFLYGGLSRSLEGGFQHEAKPWIFEIDEDLKD